MFCLNKTLTQEFLKRLKSGEINPEKMASMTSKERREYFKSFLGENAAQQVNALFESKLLLQSQQQGIINWAKQVSGMKPEVQRDIISRVNKMTEILTPENQDAFLEDLAAHRLGVAVTMDEAGQIASLAKDVTTQKQAIKENAPIGSPERLAYGRAKVAFDDYINGLKDEAKSKKLREYLKPENYLEAVSNVAGFSKSIKASLDNSVIGRQGLKVLFTHPEIWLKNSKQTFVDMFKTYGGEDVMREVRADVLSRPNALSGLYRKEGLAVGVQEEAYPTSLPSKIPILGKMFKASENAFTGFQYRTRADVFDKLVEVADKTGADIKGLGKLANSLTGRGALGNLEPNANTLNNLFFSPRFLKSNIDALTGQTLDYAKMGKFSRQQAAINTVKIIGGIATIMGIAKALNPDAVELDPRSSDFGKIKIGNTRFDVSGGMSGLVVLASRIITQSQKSSSTGIVRKLNTGEYGSQNLLDLLVNFSAGKASPAAGIVLDLLRGEDFKGEKATPAGAVSNIVTPIPITNAMELAKDPDSANMLVAMIADGLGIGTNTYSAKSDWSTSDSKSLQQLHEQLGDKGFEEANEKFNDAFSEWFSEAQRKMEYKNLSDEDKQKVINNKRQDLKEKIFREYKFKPKEEKQKKLPKI